MLSACKSNSPSRHPIPAAAIPCPILQKKMVEAEANLFLDEPFPEKLSSFASWFFSSLKDGMEAQWTGWRPDGRCLGHKATSKTPVPTAPCIHDRYHCGTAAVLLRYCCGTVYC